MPLVKKAKHAKKLQNIAYGTFLFGAGATISVPLFIVYAYNYNNNIGTQFTQSERNKYGILSIVSMAGTIACPITAGYFSNKRKGYNEQAVQLYNQKY